LIYPPGICGHTSEPSIGQPDKGILNMNVVRLLPVFLSSLLIAAHFLHAGSLGLVWCSLFFPFLLFSAERWAARIVQACLIAASLVWFSTLYTLVQQRMDAGQPWMRLSLIIGAVALFTGLSACVFWWKPLAVRYKLDSSRR
jgi:hypothetical protein